MRRDTAGGDFTRIFVLYAKENLSYQLRLINQNGLSREEKGIC